MITICLLLLPCVVATVALLLLYKSHPATMGLDKLSAQLESLDVDAFLNLIDGREEDYLRTQLPPGVFRRIRRERMLAAMQYVWHAAKNAQLLMHLTEAAKANGDAEIADAADELYKEALKLRVCALQMLVRLLVSAALPGRGELSPAFARDYQAISCRFSRFARMQAGAEAARAA